MQLFCQRHSVTRVWPASLKQCFPVSLIKQWKENRVAALRTHSPGSEPAHTRTSTNTHTTALRFQVCIWCARVLSIPNAGGMHARLHRCTQGPPPVTQVAVSPLIHMSPLWRWLSLIRLLSVVWETLASAWATVYMRMKQICSKSQFVRFSSI